MWYTKALRAYLKTVGGLLLIFAPTVIVTDGR